MAKATKKQALGRGLSALLNDSGTEVSSPDKLVGSIIDLDLKMIEDLQPFFTSRQKTNLSYNIKNTDRALGTRLASEIVKLEPVNAPKAFEIKCGVTITLLDAVTLPATTISPVTAASSEQEPTALAVTGVTIKVDEEESAVALIGACTAR